MGHGEAPAAWKDLFFAAALLPRRRPWEIGCKAGRPGPKGSNWPDDIHGSQVLTVARDDIQDDSGAIVN
jgi:hypothetical protein